MDLKGKTIILGSASPRRRELLAGLGIKFTVDTGNNFVETCSPGIPHLEVPKRMAEGKSLGFHRKLEDDEILITSDTMVLCGSEIMGKPHDPEDAARMLRLLSGRGHQVVTAVTVRSNSRMKSSCDTSNVWFKELSEEEIHHYIDVYRPFDKAGAYGIQEWIGYIGIYKIEGSYFNIMGLPVHLVYSMLSEFVND